MLVCRRSGPVLVPWCAQASASQITALAVGSHVSALGTRLGSIFTVDHGAARCSHGRFGKSGKGGKQNVDGGVSEHAEHAHAQCRSRELVNIYDYLSP